MIKVKRSLFVIFIIFHQWGCALSDDIFSELDKRCAQDARLIIHDGGLWSQYLKIAEKSYLDRLEKFPETERSIIEYASGFDVRYGDKFEEIPTIPEGKVTRLDRYILKDGAIVAQYINYYAKSTFAGSTVDACILKFPQLYAFKGE